MDAKTSGQAADRPRLYHGTAHPFAEGDIVAPATSAGVAPVWGSAHPGDEAFATEDLQSAKFFAATAGAVTRPHYVYEVEPVTPTDVTTRDLQDEAGAPPVIEHRSRAGFRVIARVWNGPETPGH